MTVVDITRMLMGYLLFSLFVVRRSCPALVYPSAHKLYPVGIRVVEEESENCEWITVAYVPSVPT